MEKNEIQHRYMNRLIISLKSLKLYIFLLICSGAFQPAFSQDDSLYKYLEIAAGNNPVVRQRFIQYKAALQKVPQAGSLSDPQLDIGVYLSPMELLSGNQVADLKLMQMFPWFGVLRNAKDEMSQMANAGFEQLRDAKLQVFYDVQRTWYELYRIRQDISISEKNLDILKTIERLALIRYKTGAVSSGGSTSTRSSMPSGSSSNQASSGGSGMQGMSGQPGSGAFSTGQASQSTGQMQSSGMESGPGGSLSDLYRIRIETGDLENNIELLKNSEQTVVARFNSFLNRPPLSEVYTSDTLLADTLGISLATVTDSINQNNPMLKMIQYEKKSYEARKRMAKGMGYPMVGVGINYSVINSSEMSQSDMNGKDMIMPMVSITLPVYRKKYNAQKKEAELLGDAAEQNYQATLNSLHTEYYQAVQQYLDAKRRVKLYGEQSQLASRSLEIMLKSFSASASDLTDVLRVRQQKLDYELNRIAAVSDLNTSVALLKRLMSSNQVTETK
jgi:outer membrane protein TolC